MLRQWIITICLLAFMIGTLLGLVQLRSEFHQDRGEVRGTVLYAATEMGREYWRFIDALNRYSLNAQDATHEEVMFRYDMFWGQTNNFKSGELGRRLMQAGQSEEIISEIESLLKAIEVDLRMLESGDIEKGSALKSLVAPLGPSIHDLIQRIDKSENDYFVGVFNRTESSLHKLSGLVLLMLLSGSFLIVLLIRERNKANQLFHLATTTEGKLRKLNDELESKVRERTAQLESKTWEIQNSEKELKHQRSELQSININLAEANDELKSLKKKAEAASDAKSAFLAQMSHELRTPMNGVVGMIQVLEGTDLNELQLEYVQVVKKCGISLTEILGDIITVSSIEAGQMKLNTAPVDIEVISDNIQSIFSLEAQRKDLDLNVTCSIPENYQLLGDSIRIKQVITNLVGNAIKFTEVGEVNVHANAQQSNEQCILQIVVSDTGTGIKSERLDDIFNVFEQADNSDSREHDGLGLGLTIVDKLVKLMKGSVTVESKVAKGTVFTVKLPLQYKDLSLPEIPTNEIQNAPQTIPAKLLIVEDVSYNRMVIRAFAQKFISTIDESVNGNDAITRLNEWDYDIVFMDLKMPGMDGYETTRHIRAHEKETGCKRSIIIALTAHALDEDRERCLASDMDDYISKPVTLQQLQETVYKQWFKRQSIANN